MCLLDLLKKFANTSIHLSALLDNCQSTPSLQRDAWLLLASLIEHTSSRPRKINELILVLVKSFVSFIWTKNYKSKFEYGFSYAFSIRILNFTEIMQADAFENHLNFSVIVFWKEICWTPDIRWGHFYKMLFVLFMSYYVNADYWHN